MSQGAWLSEGVAQLGVALQGVWPRGAWLREGVVPLQGRGSAGGVAPRGRGSTGVVGGTPQW